MSRNFRKPNPDVPLIMDAPRLSEELLIYLEAATRPPRDERGHARTAYDHYPQCFEVTATGVTPWRQLHHHVPPCPVLSPEIIGYLNTVWADLRDFQRGLRFPALVMLMKQAARRGGENEVRHIDTVTRDFVAEPYYPELAWDAWLAGQVTAARQLLHVYCPRMTPQQEYFLELEKAVAPTGDEAMLNSLLENYDRRDDGTWTAPLDMALQAGHQSVVVTLLRRYVHLIKRARVPSSGKQSCWEVFRHYYREYPVVLAEINALEAESQTVKAEAS